MSNNRARRSRATTTKYSRLIVRGLALNDVGRNDGLLARGRRVREQPCRAHRAPAAEEHGLRLRHSWPAQPGAHAGGKAGEQRFSLQQHRGRHRSLEEAEGRHSDDPLAPRCLFPARRRCVQRRRKAQPRRRRSANATRRRGHHNRHRRLTSGTSSAAC